MPDVLGWKGVVAMMVLLSLRIRRLLLWGQVQQYGEVDGIPFEVGSTGSGVFRRIVFARDMLTCPLFSLLVIII